ncbi:MAG: hypothetical protein K9G65_02430 [Rickettsiaceae bacterium]|jgi:hypothetical protein|nr:hypothetical protein [Rickettsiaceae bacterium]
MIHKLNFSTTNDKDSVLSKYCCGMPYKYPEDKGWKIPKQKYKLTNWSEYNKALKDRGRIDFWLDKEAEV